MCIPSSDRDVTGLEARPDHLAGVVWERVSLFARASSVMVYRAHLAKVDCDLWCIQTSQHEAIYQWDSDELSLLQPEELERGRRFRFERDRRLSLAKRLMARGVLSHYAAVAPQDWRFDEGPYGRPRISHGFEELALDFNLSSSRDVAVCVVSHTGLIGVDVEDLTAPDASEVSTAILGRVEKNVFNRLAEEERRVAFLRYWTLKEAYVKARGIGLTLPIEEVCFDGIDTEKITVSFGSGVDDNPSSWEFTQRTIFDRHIVAVAKRR